MKKVLQIIAREYKQRVQKKSFILMTILTPILIIAFMAVMIFIMISGFKSANANILVVDQSNNLSNHLVSTDQVHYTFSKEILNKEQITAQLANDSIDGVLVLEDVVMDSLQSQDIEYTMFSQGTIASVAYKNIEKSLSEELTNRKMLFNKLDLNLVENSKIKVSVKTLNEDQEDISDQNVMSKGISFISFYIMFFFVMFYGTQVMRSVMEEKNNRVVEVILSSVKPKQLLFGKILSNFLVSLTQFVIWILLFGGAIMAISYFLPDVSNPAEMPEMSMGGTSTNQIAEVTRYIEAFLQLDLLQIAGVFLIYFIFGFLIYSSFYAAIGGLVSNQNDSQQFIMIVILPVIVGLYASFGIVEDPNSNLAFWFSMIPLTSPVCMMARIPFGVPGWELALSIFLLIVFLYLVVVFSGKVYRVGLLFSKSKPSFKDVIKWLKWGG